MGHTNISACEILLNWFNDLVLHNVPDETQVFGCEGMLVFITGSMNVCLAGAKARSKEV
jgi:hypothetical protein